jgi:hypothetical protein
MPLISMGSILTQRRKGAKTLRKGKARATIGGNVSRQTTSVVQPERIHLLSASLRLCAFALNPNCNSRGLGTAQ